MLINLTDEQAALVRRLVEVERRRLTNESDQWTLAAEVQAAVDAWRAAAAGVMAALDKPPEGIFLPDGWEECERGNTWLAEDTDGPPNHVAWFAAGGRRLEVAVTPGNYPGFEVRLLSLESGTDEALTAHVNDELGGWFARKCNLPGVSLTGEGYVSRDEDDEDDSDEFDCAECGEPARENPDGTTNHLSDTEPTGVDHDADEDHVPYREDE